MVIGEERIFVEKPFDVLKIVIPTLAVIFIFIVFIVSYNGVPPRQKGVQFTAGGFILMILFAEAVIFLILFFTLSFLKKQTIICDLKGCEISGIDFWGNMSETERFLWSDVNGTDLTLTSIGRGGKQLNLMLTANGKEKRLLSRTIYNRHEFDELLETVNQATPHLSYELEKTKNAGNRQVIAEAGNYCRVAR